MMKNLIPCFTVIKRSTFADHHPATLTPDDLSRPFHSVTHSAFRNFNSLFDYNAADCHSICSEPEPEPIPEQHSDSEPDTEPDFAAAVASQRFFFASPGRSNSIIESCPSISTVREDTGSSMLISPSPSDRHWMAMDGGDESTNNSVAVQTYSPDPYADFRRSMQDMVEARGLHDAKANWEKLHELLLCYLALNPKSAHSYIVRAFADLLVTLMSSSPVAAPRVG